MSCKTETTETKVSKNFSCIGSKTSKKNTENLSKSVDALRKLIKKDT